MLENILREIKRDLIIDGQVVEDLEYVLAKLEEGQLITVQLKPIVAVPSTEEQHEEEPQQLHAGITTGALLTNHTYLIKVRQYMTLAPSDNWGFHDKWNSGNPMPFRIMQGRVLKETRGIVYMDCIAVPLKIDVCMRCGRKLTHPVSRLYGIGPECGGHAHINPFNTEEELLSALDKVTEQLAKITWRGWIIKSAIEQYQEVF